MKLTNILTIILMGNPMLSTNTTISSLLTMGINQVPKTLNIRTIQGRYNLPVVMKLSTLISMTKVPITKPQNNNRLFKKNAKRSPQSQRLHLKLRVPLTSLYKSKERVAKYLFLTIVKHPYLIPTLYSFQITKKTIWRKVTILKGNKLLTKFQLSYIRKLNIPGSHLTIC